MQDDPGTGILPMQDDPENDTGGVGAQSGRTAPNDAIKLKLAA
jgi:hypothetical protein